MKEESLLLLSDLQKLINQVVLIDYTIIILGGERMKKVNKKVLKVVEHVMRNEAVYGIDRFPPACMGIFHQPKRPIIQKKSER